MRKEFVKQIDSNPEAPAELVSLSHGSALIGANQSCTLCGATPAVTQARYKNPLGNIDYTHIFCDNCADKYGIGQSNTIYRAEPMEQAFLLLKNQNERWDEIIRDYNERKFDELLAGFHQRHSPNRSLRLTSAQNTSKYHPSKNLHLARKLTNPENISFRDHNLQMNRGEELPLETIMTQEPLGGRFVFPSHALGLTPRQGSEFVDVPESKRAYPLNLYGFEGTPERYGKNQDPEGIIYGDLEKDSVRRLNKKPFMLRDLQRAASMFLPRSKNAPPSRIGLEGAQRNRVRELAQMIMDAEIPGALIDPQTARAYGIKSFQDIVPTKIGPDGKVISSITENLNDLTGNIGGGMNPLHGTFQQWERTMGPSGRVAELDETHTSPEQMQLLDDQLTAIPGAIQPAGRYYKSEPMDLAMRLLKNRPYHEMSNDELEEIFFGKTGYDVGEGTYTRDKTISSQKEKNLALQELLTRMRETEGNPVSVFDNNQEEKSRLVDFYEPQFAGQNISPDVFIPQNEKEGQEAYEFMEDGEMGEHIDDRLMDIDDVMPGKTFLADPDYADKYNHLRATAPPEVAENFLNRYRDFVMRNNENPEYVNQSLMQMFDENQKITAPQYTQEFPTDASIFDTEVPYKTMNTPDATGFQHNWQAKNASEPMEIAMRLLKRQTTLSAFDERQIQENLKPKNSNIFIAAKPDNEETKPEELSQLSNNMLAELTALKEKHGEFGITSATGNAAWDLEPSFMLTNVPQSARGEINAIAEKYRQDSIAVSEKDETGAKFVTPQGRITDEYSNMEMDPNAEYSTDFPTGQRLTFKSEPMEIAMRLLKERVSPEAKRHKLEYDKKYESSPERVKYREELNRERRRRHIMGQGGPDMSHTSQHTIVPEDPHTNRARHFKDKGTLL